MVDQSSVDRLRLGGLSGPFTSRALRVKVFARGRQRGLLLVPLSSCTVLRWSPLADTVVQSVIPIAVLLYPKHLLAWVASKSCVEEPRGTTSQGSRRTRWLLGIARKSRGDPPRTVLDELARFARFKELPESVARPRLELYSKALASHCSAINETAFKEVARSVAYAFLSPTKTRAFLLQHQPRVLGQFTFSRPLKTEEVIGNRHFGL